MDKCSINGKTIATARNINGLYRLNIMTKRANATPSSKAQFLLHKRLCHQNHYSMDLLKHGLATGITYKRDGVPVYGKTCIRGKQDRKPFVYNKAKSLAKDILDLVHSDLVGPLEVESWRGARFMFSLIDDHSKKYLRTF